MTAAGRDAIDQAFGQSVIAAHLPYDYAFAVRRFLGHFRPSVGVLIETELWINLLAECRRRSIPVMLASGRMSQKSARGYRRLSGLTRPAFEGLAAVCAQTEDDASRIAALGAHHVSVAGNLKFDFVPDAGLLGAGGVLKSAWAPRKAILLASTREGEEIPLLQAFLARRSGAPLLIMVPRHPQRFESVAALITAAGMTYVRRSRREPIGPADVLLGDTMGEMATYYSAADVAIVGGSLLPYGGQNLIEACAIGVPVVIGPHVHNFSEAVRLAVEAGAAVQVSDAGEAIGVALELLGDPARCAAMGAAGLAFCAAHRGATAKHLAAVKSLLRP
jgi:3-deoxy-D-manno-octulosonic-acid transferase